jgi:fumarylacetoacetase
VTVGTRIGDFAIDLGALQQLNFEGIELTDDMFMQDTLNDFISDGKKTWRLVNRIADLFDEENPKLRDIAKHRDIVIFNIDEVEMQLPVLIGDYTDFYSSKEHATNVGKMFRDPENALPNWLLPRRISWEKLYHNTFRNSVHRPIGQTLPAGETTPVFGLLV